MPFTSINPHAADTGRPWARVACQQVDEHALPRHSVDCGAWCGRHTVRTAADAASLSTPFINDWGPLPRLPTQAPPHSYCSTAATARYLSAQVHDLLLVVDVPHDAEVLIHDLAHGPRVDTTCSIMIKSIPGQHCRLRIHASTSIVENALCRCCRCVHHAPMRSMYSGCPCLSCRP